MTTVVSVAQGGTGSNSAALARTALGVPPSAAYDQANTARDQANTARTQANTAYAQANSAYSDANTRLSASGGTLAGDLIITGNLTVSGNSTTLNAEILTIEDADVVLLSNVASTPALNAGIIVNRGTSTNTFLRWDEVTDKWGWSDDGSTTYKFTSALDAYAQANSAYGAANNTVLKAGDTMTGQLNISAGGLLVTGNSNFDSGTLFVDSVNDRIGIGTTSPGSRLHILDSSGPVLRMVRTSNRFDIEADNNAMGFVSRDSATANAYFSGFTSIGIGTTSPSGLWSGDQRVLHLFSSGSTAAGVRISSVNATAEFFSSAGSVEWGLYSNTAAPFTIYTNGSERLRITSGGNLGIGTSSPGTRLDISSTQASGITMRYDTSTGYRALITPYWNSGTDTRIDFAINSVANQTPSVYMSVGYNGGNIGIGTTSPQGKQHNYLSSRSTAFNPADGATWHDLIIQNPNSTQNAAVGIAFELNSSYHSNAGTGIAAVKSTASSDYGADLAFITRPQNAVAEERMRITSAGNVGIGTTSPPTTLSIGAPSHTSPGDTNRILNWYSTGGSELHNSAHRITVGVNSADTSQPQVVGISLFNSNSTANNWSPILMFGGLSTSGNYMNGSAGIAAKLPANADSNFRGGDLHFFTQGTASPLGLSTKVVIKADGVLELTNGQIKFPATQVASADVNTLDDYEEGTFDPTLTTAETAPTGVAYSSRIGKYTKIGRVVYIHVSMILSSKGTGGSGYVLIGNLPFTVSNDGNYANFGALIDTLASDLRQVSVQLYPNSTVAYLIKGGGSTGTHDGMALTDITNSTTIRVGFFYTV